MRSYQVRLAPGAARTFGRLSVDERDRIRRALNKLAQDVGTPGRIGGKTVKSIRGTDGAFHRLRVGDQRVLYDVIDADGVILVLGIVDRSDLEHWLRRR